MSAPATSLRKFNQLALGTLAIARLCCFAPVAWGGETADRGAMSKPARIVTRYALTSSHDAVQNDPKSWRLLASNDGGQTWALLDVRTNQQFTARSQRRLFFIPNRAAYGCYRLQVDDSNSSDLDIYFNTSVQLAEVELLGPVVGAPSETDLQCLISASDAHPLLGPAENAFDSDLTTRWFDLGLWHRKPCWIQCQYVSPRDLAVTNLSRVQDLARLAVASGAAFDKAPVVWSNLQTQAKMPLPTLTAYALTSANDVPERDPRDWRLLGSSDGGKTWITNDVRHDQLFTSRFQRRVFQLTNAASDSLYRLQVDATRSPGNFVQLAEIEPLYSRKSSSNQFTLLVSAHSDNPQVEAVDMAFDGDPKTKWLSFTPVTREQPGWAEWQYVRPQEEQPVINRHVIDRFGDQRRLASILAQSAPPRRTLKGYALTSANDHPERDPIAWRLLGSNDDGKSWTTLDARKGELFPARFQRRVFVLGREATFATYGFQIDSVVDPANANSVQLAEFEPLYAAGAGPVGSMVVSAQGENPREETTDKLFDSDPKTKWLDFADVGTNRASWFQWFYAAGQDLPVINFDQLKSAQSPVRQRYRLDLESVVVGTGLYSNIVALVDQNGFQMLRLASNQPQLHPGERIRLAGQLRFGGPVPTVLDPVFTRLGLVPLAPLLSDREPNGTQPDFVRGTVQGQAAAFWQDQSYLGMRLFPDLSGVAQEARILNSGPVLFVGPLNCHLQMRGVVQPVFNELGEKVSGILWVNSLEDVALVTPTDLEWKSWPERSLASLAQSDAALGQLLRVRGRLVDQQLGFSLVLGDGTNRVVVYSKSNAPLSRGTMMEAAGFLVKTNDAPALVLAYSRLQGQAALPASPGEPVANNPREPITEIPKVREFIRTHPNGDCPIRLRGVITYIDIGVSDFYLCDGVESIDVSGQVGAGLSPFLRQEGMFIELNGVAHNGAVYATERVRVLGHGQMPVPLRHSWQYLMTGKADGQWVELEGVVATVEKQRLTLIADGCQIVAWVNSLGRNVPGAVLGSRVKAAGVCSPVMNNRNQRLGLRLLVPSGEYLEVVKAGPENPFELAAVPLAKLGQADLEGSRLIKAKGIVTYVEPRMFFLQDQSNGLRVLPQQDTSLEVGDVAEVVGLVEPDGLSPKLVQALVQKVGESRIAPAQRMELSLDTARQQAEDDDGVRVQMEATLLGVGLKETRQVLELQLENSGRSFCAFLPASRGLLPPTPPGSRLRLEGVFKANTAITEDLEQTITTFELYLNGPADVRVLARPPWWTPGRLVGLLLGVLAASALVLGWGLLISRKNILLKQAQTEMQLARDRLERRVEERTHELARSLSLLNAALESTADGILVVDLNGAITSSNTKFAQMWRVPRDVIESWDDARLLSLVLEQLQDQDAFLAKIQELYATPDAISFDILEFQDGRVFERYSQAQRLDGQCVGRVWCFRDVTARVRTEAELAFERDLFKSLVDNLPDLIYFKDLQSRFVRVGKAKLQESYHLALCQYQAAHPENGPAPLPEHLADLEKFSAYLKDKTDFDLYPEDRARSAYEDEQQILRTGNPLVGKVERTALPNGRVSWLLTTKMLWRAPSGRVVGTFGTSKDITAIKDAEAKLESLHQQLVEASRQAGMAEVATSVLHNVGNVLNSVNVAAAVLLNLARKSNAAQVAKLAALLEEHRHDLPDYLTQEGRVDHVIGYLKALGQHLAAEQTAMLKELHELSGNIDHIKEIVSRQQSYAKVSGVLDLQSVPALVDDALRMHADSLARHEVQVIRQFEPVPDIVLDKHKVLQILVNLIGNAKDALADRTSESRRLTLGLALHSDSRVKISVTDNGRGIEAENITRIFSHGFTTKKDGHGFGLHSGAITAREMGGSLQVHSEGVNRGATFTLELPVRHKNPNV